MPTSLNSAHYQGVIFDLDNTLVSSTLNFTQIKQAINCPTNIDVLAYIESLNTQDAREAMNTVLEFEHADAEQAKPMPGVQACLAMLKKQGIKLAVVTRNCRHAAQIKLQKTGLEFDIVLSRDDAPAKPDPTALLFVAEQWGYTPKQCIYVGDYLYDIQAADNANMSSCLYTPDGIPEYAHKARYVMAHFDQLHGLIHKGAASF